MFVTALQKSLFTALLCLTLALMAIPTYASECGSEPTPYTASYSVIRNDGQEGSMQVILERKSPDTFSYRMDTRVPWGIFTAHIEQQSDFSVRNGAVWPGRFRLTQKVSLYKRSESVDFDWESMQATGTKKKKDFELELQAGMQDKLTIYLFLARALCAGENPIYANVVSGSEVKHYRYDLQAVESLDTNLGLLQVSHLSRGSSADEKQTDLWNAEATRFLPVRMVYRNEDGITDMRLIDISFSDGL